MENDWQWKLKLKVQDILPKTHHDYEVKLEFDDEPYKRTLDQLSREMDSLDKNPTLARNIDARDRKNLENRQEKTLSDMEAMRDACQNIEFVMEVEEVKYSGTSTLLTAKILDSVVEPLNNQKYRLNEYRAILTPVIKII